METIFCIESEYSNLDVERIRKGLERDQENGNYTVLEYMERASRLPHEMLTALLTIPDQNKRMELVRGLALAPTLPKSRIWKKCK